LTTIYNPNLTPGSEQPTLRVVFGAPPAQYKATAADFKRDFSLRHQLSGGVPPHVAHAQDGGEVGLYCTR
jgi:hypothetical protein